jgi:asparagine synthase (glutamine-hydrolysing)
MAQLLLSLPENYLISDAGETKHVFRAAMRGIVPDEILDRRDKIGFATPERDWFMSIAPMTREWLQDAEAVPFLDRDALLAAFDSVIAGRTRFTWQVWRWVNYVRWYAMHNFERIS